MDQHPSDVWTHEPADLTLTELSIMARSMIAARRALHGQLPSAMVHDPALDLLLSLFVAHAAGRTFDLGELANRTTVGPSVALRWIKALEQAGLVELTETLVTLNDDGIAAVTNALLAVSRSQWHLA